MTDTNTNQKVQDEKATSATPVVAASAAASDAPIVEAKAEEKKAV